MGLMPDEGADGIGFGMPGQRDSTSFLHLRPALPSEISCKFHQAHFGVRVGLPRGGPHVDAPGEQPGGVGVRVRVRVR